MSTATINHCEVTEAQQAIERVKDEAKQVGLSPSASKMMRHNYFARIVGLLADGKLPPERLSDLVIQHDELCHFPTGGLCDCLPDMYLECRKL